MLCGFRGSVELIHGDERITLSEGDAVHYWSVPESVVTGRSKGAPRCWGWNTMTDMPGRSGHGEAGYSRVAIQLKYFLYKNWTIIQPGRDDAFPPPAGASKL